MKFCKSQPFKYKDKLAIFIGVEADYLPSLVTPRDFNHHNLDYKIGSLHFLYPEKAEKFGIAARHKIEKDFNMQLNPALLETLYKEVIN